MFHCLILSEITAYIFYTIRVKEGKKKKAKKKGASSHHFHEGFVAGNLFFSGLIVTIYDFCGG